MLQKRRGGEFLRVISEIQCGHVEAEGANLVNQVFQASMRRAYGSAPQEAPLQGAQTAQELLRVRKAVDLALPGFFETLPEDERRETLVSYADNAKKQEPREGEKFDLVDVRKDEECMDTVGVYLHVDEHGKAHIRMTLGPEVQTLTRSMTAILCKGLEGSTPQEILDLPSDFVTRIVGTELVRIRSQTIYYVLTRIKSICKVYLDRQRMAQVA